jgi:negative regulator of flagellin synthesis FlgM
MLRLNRAFWRQLAGSEPPPAYLVLAFRYSKTAGCVDNDPVQRWPRERKKMYIYGTSQIHAAQPINAPHRMTPTQGAGNVSSFRGVDQLDISPQADFVAQARDLPEIREDRVAALKAQIQSGTYETADKLDMALSRLLDEIA